MVIALFGDWHPKIDRRSQNRQRALVFFVFHFPTAMQWLWLLLTLLSVIVLSQGVVVTWAGTTSSGQDWNNLLNWNPNKVPDASDDVVISGSSLAPCSVSRSFVAGYSSQIASLKIGASCELTIVDPLTVTGLVPLSSYSVVASRINLQSTLVASSGSSVNSFFVSSGSNVKFLVKNHI